ncbi:MAG: hypothetical protein PVF76_04895 [Syntrophobacterales bacterium]|jgi:hypothetical protein
MAAETNLVEQNGIEQALLKLNERLTSRALSIWMGKDSIPSQLKIYDGFEHLLDPSIILQMRSGETESRLKNRVFHTLLGHYLQYRVFPYENELFTWLKGAAAHVNGEKIYFKDILSWCQKRSDLQGRRILEKETSSLCKFLKPFALSFWEAFLELLNDEFGYKSYSAYCEDKKLIDYENHFHKLQQLLEQTGEIYLTAMEGWVQNSLGLPLAELNRFDSIYLLGLGELDRIFPKQIPLVGHLEFFQNWGIRVANIPGLHLEIDYSPRKSFQAMSFALRIPHDIHLVMNPQGGWIDLETLFHEMGHALSNVFTDPELSPPEKDFFTSNTLSESYAFLLQNMCLSPPFLERQLKLSPRQIDEITFYKTLKDMSVFRRYGGKFMAEYQMFKANNLTDGDFYASLLKKYTGFSYLPETQLFDLAPEFYALDYLISWMAEATMEKFLRRNLGSEWMFKREAGMILKDWWRAGNRYEFDDFFQFSGLGPIDSSDILKRWINKIPTTNENDSPTHQAQTPDELSKN